MGSLNRLPAPAAAIPDLGQRMESISLMLGLGPNGFTIRDAPALDGVEIIPLG
jgi:hypothetical protein